MIATPGEGFGPFDIGKRLVRSPLARCQTPALGPTNYFPDLGLVVSTASAAHASSQGIAEDTVIVVSVELEQTVDPALTRELGGTCVSPNGTVLTRLAKYRLPEGYLHLSNKSVGLRATVENVLAAHGRPWRVQQIDGTQVTLLDYCGIFFYFGATELFPPEVRGRVRSFGVRHRRLCAP